jgi:hypothetical protein
MRLPVTITESRMAIADGGGGGGGGGGGATTDGGGGALARFSGASFAQPAITAHSAAIPTKRSAFIAFSPRNLCGPENRFMAVNGD